MTTVPPSTFGIPALRSEDPRFLRGQGRYLENIEVEGSLRAVFVRSIFAHAELHEVEGLEEARAMPGVVAVFTADDLAIPAQPPAGVVEAPGEALGQLFDREVLARDRLRYVGEPYEQYFRGVEAIMDDHSGRPHWGKMHYQTAATLGPRYPEWDRFAAVRRRIDPDGRFRNAYLDRVLGPPS